MKMDKSDLLLYAITDRSWLGGDTLYNQVELALKGGTTLIQLREKNLEQEKILEEARELQQLCHKYNCPLIVNDSVDIALAIDADGVHVGQEDMEAGDVRRLLGSDKILGVSAHSVEEAIRAEQAGADYLGAGAVFPTGSKTDAAAMSFETLRDICEAVSIPVVAIGGITQENVLQLKGSGICGIAVISAIFAQPDIQEAARQIKEAALEVVKY